MFAVHRPNLVDWRPLVFIRQKHLTPIGKVFDHFLHDRNFVAHFICCVRTLSNFADLKTHTYGHYYFTVAVSERTASGTMSGCFESRVDVGVVEPIVLSGVHSLFVGQSRKFVSLPNRLSAQFPTRVAREFCSEPHMAAKSTIALACPSRSFALLARFHRPFHDRVFQISIPRFVASLTQFAVPDPPWKATTKSG